MKVTFGQMNCTSPIDHRPLVSASMVTSQKDEDADMDTAGSEGTELSSGSDDHLSEESENDRAVRLFSNLSVTCLGCRDPFRSLTCSPKVTADKVDEADLDTHPPAITLRLLPFYHAHENLQMQARVLHDEIVYMRTVAAAIGRGISAINVMISGQLQREGILYDPNEISRSFTR